MLLESRGSVLSSSIEAPFPGLRVLVGGGLLRDAYLLDEGGLGSGGGGLFSLCLDFGTSTTALGSGLLPVLFAL